MSESGSDSVSSPRRGDAGSVEVEVDENDDVGAVADGDDNGDGGGINGVDDGGEGDLSILLFFLSHEEEEEEDDD